MYEKLQKETRSSVALKAFLDQTKKHFMRDVFYLKELIHLKLVTSTNNEIRGLKQVASDYSGVDAHKKNIFIFILILIFYFSKKSYIFWPNTLSYVL